MVIEWLRFQVKPGLREGFIAKDDAIWSAVLRQYPAYLGKEVWIDPEKEDEITLMIRWRDRQGWKSVPTEALHQTEAEFARQMGTNTYQLLETREYQVRRFSQPD